MCNSAAVMYAIVEEATTIIQREAHTLSLPLTDRLFIC